MTRQDDHALARIYHKSGGTIAGAGFYVGLNDGAGYLITCAHVVNVALGRNKWDQRLPEDSITADFVANPSLTRHSAVVVDWAPPQLDRRGADIAVLRLTDIPPGIIQPPVLYYEDAAFDQGCMIRGYFAEERVFLGIVEERLTGTGRLSIRPKDEHQMLEEGFSGAPVWNDLHSGVIGMVVTMDKDFPAKGGAIPVTQLVEAWKPLEKLLYFPQPDAGTHGREPIRRRWAYSLR